MRETLSPGGLAELLLTLEAASLSAEVLIECDRMRASVSLRHGDLVDAAFGTFRGEKALYRVLALNRGSFELAPPDAAVGGAFKKRARRLFALHATRVEPWTKRLKACPPLDGVLARKSGPASQSLSERQRALLAACDGQRTLWQVLGATNLGTVAALRDIGDLLVRGLLERGGGRSLGEANGVEASASNGAAARPPPVERTTTLKDFQPVSFYRSPQRSRYPRTLTGFSPVESPTGQSPIGQSPTPTFEKLTAAPVISISGSNGARTPTAERRRPPDTIRGWPEPEGSLPSQAPATEADFFRRISEPTEQTAAIVHAPAEAATPVLRNLSPQLEEPASDGSRPSAPPRNTIVAPKNPEKYELGVCLENAGASAVYLARQRATTSVRPLVAIKVFASPDSPQPLEIFLSQVRQVPSGLHPNLVDVLDVGPLENPYLAMAYVEGGTLGDLLAARWSSPALLLPPIIEALRGLHALHALGSRLNQPLVHGNITPRALLIGTDGGCRLAGLAPRNAPGDDLSTLAAAFRSPEQLRGLPLDARADVFSMGAVLYAALTGTPPFGGSEAAVDVLHNQLHRPLPPPSSIGNRPPACFDAVCAKALAPGPADRFPTAEQFADELERIGSREGWLASRTEISACVLAAVGKSLQLRALALRDSERPPAAASGALGAGVSDELASAKDRQKTGRSVKRRGLVYAMLAAATLLALILLLRPW